MDDSTGKMGSTYKNDRVYRIVSILFPLVLGAIFILFIWLSRNEARPTEPRTITLYCFSAMEAVMEEQLFPSFQALWLEQNSENVEFIATFAGSGVITRQIITRFPAEIAILSSELDARRLVGAGIISVAEWQNLQQRERFCRTPIVFFVSNNAPTSVNTFDDLEEEKSDIIIPDPLTSGEGQMAALAIYGSQLRKGVGHKAALKFTSSIFSKTLNQPSTSQAALEQFHAGLGDILLNYEAATGFHKGNQDLRVVYPEATIMTEPVAVTLNKNISKNQQVLLQAFYDYLWSSSAQLALSEYGFITINTSEEPGFSPTSPYDIFTLDSLGGAFELNRSVIEPLLELNQSNNQQKIQNKKI